MKNHKLKIIFLVIVAIICIAIPVVSIADVGDFESYDSDWGSSSWDSDWDSDWGSSSGGDSDAGMILFLIEILIHHPVMRNNINCIFYSTYKSS